MTQHKQLIETIEKALESATKGQWKGKHAINPYISVQTNVDEEVIATVHSRKDLNLLSNSPEWLRFLLEENKRLTIALHTHESYDKTVAELYEELEQVKAERDRNIGLNWERVFPIIENALGFELRLWQKYYLQTGRGMPTARMNGRTTTYCIRLALTHEKPIKLEDIGKHRDEEHGSQYVRWFHHRFLDVWTALKDAGLPVVEIVRTGAGGKP